MKKPLVSIIVPVYNVEEYVGECIESILNQSYENIEVIILDDGSTDQSAEICIEYAKQDGRIKFYQQENKGLATTRKNASIYVTGEYIIFVDSDDYLEKIFLEEMMFKGKGYDLVTSGYYSGYGKNVKCFDAITEGTYTSETDLKYIHANMIFKGDRMGIHRSVWAKMYKRELALKVFEEIDEKIIWGEDGDFLYRYILNCNSICITSICGYYYRMREGSLMHATNRNYMGAVNAIYQSLEPVISNHEDSEVLLPQFYRYMMQMINQMPYYLGFPLEMHSTPYVYPELNLLVGKNVIIYGAGNVGRSYKLFFERHAVCNVKLWVDKNATSNDEKYTISKIEDIKDCQYDYVIVAIKSEGVAKEVIEELAEAGIDANKILWSKPIES